MPETTDKPTAHYVYGQNDGRFYEYVMSKHHTKKHDAVGSHIMVRRGYEDSPWNITDIRQPCDTRMKAVEKAMRDCDRTVSDLRRQAKDTHNALRDYAAKHAAMASLCLMLAADGVIQQVKEEAVA